jgi:glycosyltransferase involved in cell wall biosynthesis
VYDLPVPAPAGYILNAPAVWVWLRTISPDLLHTHQASGYGTLGTLAFFNPTILSVYGADVYDTPKKSGLHRAMVQWNLRQADWVGSTSETMAKQVQSVHNVSNLTVTPFGVDTSKFVPTESASSEDEIVIGTVKTLAPKYGIDVLIRSFQILLRRLPDDHVKRCRLLIVGGGPQRQELEQLARDIGVADRTEFAGQVPHEDVPDYLNQFDVYVALSRLESESFGVAVLEASSCALPVVVSNIGGLPEVVRDGETGIIVKPESPKVAATAIESLVTNPERCRQMGENGRAHVRDTYEWSECVERMIYLYERVSGTSTRKAHAFSR